MNASVIKHVSSALLALAFCGPLQAAEPKEPAAATSQPAAPKVSTAEARIPYHGKVVAIDPSAKTFSLNGKSKERVFNITETTRITRDGIATDISALILGEEVRGQASKNTDKWDAVSVMMGAKTEATKVKKVSAKPVAVVAEPKN